MQKRFDEEQEILNELKRKKSVNEDEKKKLINHFNNIIT